MRGDADLTKISIPYEPQLYKHVVELTDVVELTAIL